MRFDPITPTDAQIEVLYALLGARQHGISHVEMPALDAHAAFVRTHPYRVWFLVYEDQDGAEVPIGSVYLQDDNSIGMNFTAPTLARVRAALEHIEAQFAPNPPVPSKVPPHFYINVPIGARDLGGAVEALGGRAVQTAYTFADRATTTKTTTGPSNASPQGKRP